MTFEQIIGELYLENRALSIRIKELEKRLKDFEDAQSTDKHAKSNS